MRENNWFHIQNAVRIFYADQAGFTEKSVPKLYKKQYDRFLDNYFLWWWSGFSPNLCYAFKTILKNLLTNYHFNIKLISI